MRNRTRFLNRFLLPLALLVPWAACAPSQPPAPAAPAPEAATPAPAPAQAPAPAADALPPAEQLIDRYVEAIGGREAVLGPTSSRATGTFEMPAAGLTGELVVLSGEPNQMVVTTTIPGMGEIRQGYTGEVGWAVDPNMGPRVLSGAELDALRDQATELAQVRDPSLIRSAETIELTEVGGESCYAVKLVWSSGRETTDCYSPETGLLVATTATQESPMGAIEVTSRMEDYREFGGVMMPTRMTQELMGQQMIMTIQDVEYNTVDPEAFELPAEIEPLVNQPPSGAESN